MKTFREFISEASARRAPRNPGESLQDYIRRVKGIEDHPDARIADTPGAADPRTTGERTTRVSGQDVRGTGSQTQTPPRSTQTPPRQPSGSTQTQTPPRGTQQPSGAPSGTSQARPSNAYRYRGQDLSSTSRVQTSAPASSGGGKPPSRTSSMSLPSSKPAAGPGLRSRLGRLSEPLGTAVSAGLDYKERRDAGQSRARAAGGALASGAGWAKGAEFGAKLGARLPGPKWLTVGGGALVGGALGQQGTSAAYDWAADASRPARRAISKATGFDKFQQKNALIKPGSGMSGIARAQQTVDTRDARAASSDYGTKKGSGLSGIGGQTFTSRDKKGSAFMTTGAGSQRKTVELAKTQLVRDPKTGKQVVGDLAFKGGQATYVARPSVASRDTSLGARLGRALNIGRYSKEAEQQAAKQEYRTALKNTQTYQKKLGVTSKAATAQKLPGQGVGSAKVGPKKVGPKIVGPKKVGPAKPQATPGSSVRPA